MGIDRRALIAGAGATAAVITLDRTGRLGLWADKSLHAISQRAFGLHVNNASPHGVWNQPQTPIPLLGQRGIRLYESSTTWAQLNPAPGLFDWNRLDYLVAQNQRLKLDTILTLGEPPNWASPQSSLLHHNLHPPTYIEDWINYVRAVTERFRGKITFYEPWNEPDVGNFLGTPDQLLELCKTAYTTIKSIDANARVLTPAYTIGPDRDVKTKTTLAAHLADGGGNWCDGIALHAYPGDGFRPETIVSRLDKAKALATQYGFGTLPRYDTESGVRGWRDQRGAIHDRPPKFNEPLPTSGINLQSAYVTRHLLSVLASGVVQRSYWFTLDDNVKGDGYQSVMSVNMVDYPKHPQRLLAPALAYRFLAKLLPGGYLSRIRDLDSHFEVDFIGSSGASGTAYWCDDYSTYSVRSAGSKIATDNLGAVLPKGTSYLLNASPIFLYKDLLK